jgi:hypothetical protein
MEIEYETSGVHLLIGFLASVVLVLIVRIDLDMFAHRQEAARVKLVFVHRSVLFALHGGHAGQGRSQHGYESPRISLRERRVAAHLSLIRSLGRTPKAGYYA